MVGAAGGRGIPVRVDHTVEAEIVALFKRVQEEQRRLDVLVNVITGQPVESWSPFWKQSVEKGLSALAITPGFMRTEAILDKFEVTEANWREAAEKNAEAKRFGFKDSETPCMAGRAVAALAADPEVRRRSGGVYSSYALSQDYGFTDLDGRQPNANQAWATGAAAESAV